MGDSSIPNGFFRKYRLRGRRFVFSMPPYVQIKEIAIKMNVITGTNTYEEGTLT